MGITQEELAEEMGVSRQTISSWEANVTSPDLESAAKLARYFKVSLDDLVDDKLTVHCKSSCDNLLQELVSKEVYLDVDDEDYRLLNTPCKIISIDDDFIKFEFKNGKKSVTKLVDAHLVYSYKIVEKKGKK